MDADEAKAFKLQCVECLDKVGGMPKLTSETVMKGFLQQLFELLEKGASIGGDISKYLKGVRELYLVVLATLYEALKNNQEATEKLRDTEAILWLNNEKLLNPFIAQTKRMDSSDIIPALLSEDIATILLVVEMLGNNPEAVPVRQLRRKKAHPAHVALKNDLLDGGHRLVSTPRQKSL